MKNSKQLAGLIGPVIILMTISEAINEHIWVSNIASMIYLNGTILFVAGFSIIRVHNIWRGWPILITLVSWFFMLLGLFRMFAPDIFLQGVQNTSPVMRIVPPSVLSIIGIYLTFKGYGREINPQSLTTRH